MRRLAVIALLLLTLVLSGCVVIIGPVTSAQQDVIGKVRVSFRICASGVDDGPQPPPPDETEDHPGCPDGGNNGTAGNDTVQVLLAFRVPAGTGVPDTITTDPEPSPPAGGPGTFARNAGYASELQTLVPAPAGFEWVGYISTPYVHSNGDDDVPAQFSDISVDFDLPRAANGGPFAGPFSVRPVVGFRGGEVPATQRVSCGDSAFGGGGPFGGGTACIDSPSSMVTATSIAVATRDLGIVAGNATASPGQTVQLPFDANVNGTLPGGTTFSVAAATNLPGATATPSPASFTPAPNSSTRITVPVAVRRNQGPGTFNVTVTASLPNGQTRTATSQLTVRDRQNPVAAALRIRPKTISPQAPSVAAPARVSYRLSEAATMRFRIQRCRKVRRGNRRRARTRCRTLRGSFTHAGKAGANRFRFTGFLRNRALRPGSYRLVGTPTDPAKNKGKSIRASFRVRR